METKRSRSRSPGPGLDRERSRSPRHGNDDGYDDDTAHMLMAEFLLNDLLPAVATEASRLFAELCMKDGHLHLPAFNVDKKSSWKIDLRKTGPRITATATLTSPPKQKLSSLVLNELVQKGVPFGTSLKAYSCTLEWKLMQVDHNRSYADKSYSLRVRIETMLPFPTLDGTAKSTIRLVNHVIATAETHQPQLFTSIQRHFLKRVLNVDAKEVLQVAQPPLKLELNEAQTVDTCLVRAGWLAFMYNDRYLFTPEQERILGKTIRAAICNPPKSLILKIDIDQMSLPST